MSSDIATDSLKRPAPEEAESSTKRSASDGPAGDSSSSTQSGFEQLSIAGSSHHQQLMQQQPFAEEERAIIRQQVQRPLVKDDVWYLIPSSWYRTWDNMHNGAADIEQPGPIDTSNLLTDSGDLKSGPVQSGDVEYIHEQGWELLSSWYGVTGHSIARMVIPESSTSSICKIELFPPSISLVMLSSDKPQTISSSTMFNLSVSSTYYNLLSKAREVFGISSDREIRLWRLGSDHSLTDLKDSILDPLKVNDGDEIIAEDLDLNESSDLRDAQLDERNVTVGVEQQDENDNWPTAGNSASAHPTSSTPIFSNNFFNDYQPSNNASSSSSLQDSFEKPVTRSQGSQGRKVRGLTGLANLGNTCFMNSALQCLANCPELRSYFLSGVHREELNRQNPLGMGGQVAEAFGDLVENLSRNLSSFAPRRFKQVIGRFNPTFLGWQQQDSQELIAFLLDGVHEDLNRIKNKPATTNPEYKGGGDEELAELARIAWEQYKSRNDSAIVDFFQGVYKSKLTCPDCHKISVTFDPYMYVTLHLPPRKWKGWLFVVPLDHDRPTYKVNLELPAEWSIRQAKTFVGEKTGIDGKNMVSIEVYNHKFFKEWSDFDILGSSNSKNDTIVFYEIKFQYPQRKRFMYSSMPPIKEGLENVLVPVYHTVKASKPKQSSQGASYGMSRNRLNYFGIPFLISMSIDEAKHPQLIKKTLLQFYARCASEPSILVDDSETEDIMDEDKDMSTKNEEVKENGSTLTGEANENRAKEATAAQSLRPAREPFSILVSKSPSQLGQLDDSRDYSREDLIPLEESNVNYSEETDQKRRKLMSVPGSFGPSSTDDTHELYGTDEANGEGTSAGQAVSSADDDSMQVDQVTQEPAQLLATGYGVVCEWTPSAAKAVFGDDHSGKFWDVKEIDTTEGKPGKEKKSENLLLDSLWDSFTREDVLGEENAWYCSNCKEHKGQATKKLDLWSVPDVLVVHLKRFHSAYEKVSDYVEFPLTGLDLEGHVRGPETLRKLAEKYPEEPSYREAIDNDSLIYDLFGVVNHFGGVGGGHYTAYAMNGDNGKWYNFDDSMVSPVKDPESVKTSAAYVLFYRRRTSRPIGGKTVEIVNSAIQSQAASGANSRGTASPAATDDSKSSLGLRRSNLSLASQQEAKPPADGEQDWSDEGAEVGSQFSGEWSRIGTQSRMSDEKNLPAPEAVSSGPGSTNTTPNVRSADTSWTDLSEPEDERTTSKA